MNLQLLPMNNADLSYNFDLSQFNQLQVNPFNIINTIVVLEDIVKEDDPSNKITAICKTEEEVINHLNSLN